MPIKAKLEIFDQVNIKFHGLEPHTRRKLVDKVKFFVHSSRHTPSYKLGHWDGCISYATVGGGSYVNLLEQLLPIVINDGYELDIVDHRPENNFSFPIIDENYFSDINWPEGHPIAGQPIVLRDYQVEAINAYLTNTQSMCCLSTGSGKTALCAALSKNVEKYGRSIIIVPNRDLVTQTETDYRNVGLDVGVYFGGRKELGHTHTICTWQSLSSLDKTTKKKKSKEEIDEFPLEKFIENVVCVIVDEAHTCNGKVLRELLCGPFANIPIRWGMTGTIPKEDFESYALKVSIGDVVATVKAKDLQDQGVLSNCHINIVQSKNNDVSFDNYPAEHKYLTTDKKRIEWLAEYSKKVAETGNTLILVDRIATGEMLAKLIPDSIFVRGSTKSSTRQEEYQSIQTSDNKTIIAVYKLAAVGINLPRLFNIVLFEPGKSFVRVIQSIGRGLRKAQDKDFVNVHDICSSLKFSARQLTKRKEFYEEAEYPYDITKIDYR